MCGDAVPSTSTDHCGGQTRTSAPECSCSSPQLLVSAFANSQLAQADKSINKTDIVSIFISVDCEKCPREERFRDSVTKKLHIFLHTLAHSLAHRLHNIRKKVEATCKLLTKISLFRHLFADIMFDLL